MKVALYARVSTTDQDCAVQLAELRQYAAGRGWEVAAEYVETGSGGNANRPKLAECVRDAKKRKKFTAVLVYKLDRWGRSIGQLCADILALDSAGVRFICTTQGIDTDQSNSMSRLMLNILMAFAAFERDIINERVLAGVRRAQESGTKSGKAIGRPRKVFDRQQVWEAREAGSTFRQVAEAFGISIGGVQRIMAERPLEVASVHSAVTEGGGQTR